MKVHWLVAGLSLAMIWSCGVPEKSTKDSPTRHDFEDSNRTEAMTVQDIFLQSSPYVRNGIGDITAEQIAVIRETMADRAVRMHHYLWHTIRLGWDSLNANEREFVASLGWAPPPYPYRDPRWGEDFLYMHREMILMLNQALEQRGLPKIEPWEDVPAPDDTKYPYERNGSYASSASGYRAMKTAEAKFEDDEYLRSVTLGRLSIEMEMQIHNQMHNRWTPTTLPGLGNQRLSPRIILSDEPPAGWIYDSPDYDYMGSSYASQVHPLFWKLHGWVDARIDQWLRANGYERIGLDEECTPTNLCYRWQGTWTGPMPSQNSDHTHGHHHDPNGESIFKVVQKKIEENPEYYDLVISISEKLAAFGLF